MKQFVLIIIIMLGLLTSCANRDVESEKASNREIIIACEVYGRSTTGSPLEAGTVIPLSEHNDRQTVVFEDMNFEAHYQVDQYEGRALIIVVENLDTQTEISRHLFQFDPNNTVRNQFIGGHGFTGLNYVYHPGTTAELQYFCKVDGN